MSVAIECPISGRIAALSSYFLQGVVLDGIRIRSLDLDADLTTPYVNFQGNLYFKILKFCFVHDMAL
jgi:hypothetical protein